MSERVARMRKRPNRRFNALLVGPMSELARIVSDDVVGTVSMPFLSGLCLNNHELYVRETAKSFNALLVGPMSERPTPASKTRAYFTSFNALLVGPMSEPPTWRSTRSPFVSMPFLSGLCLNDTCPIHQSRKGESFTALLVGPMSEPDARLAVDLTTVFQCPSCRAYV